MNGQNKTGWEGVGRQTDRNSNQYRPKQTGRAGRQNIHEVRTDSYTHSCVHTQIWPVGRRNRKSRAGQTNTSTQAGLAGSKQRCSRSNGRTGKENKRRGMSGAEQVVNQGQTGQQTDQTSTEKTTVRRAETTDSSLAKGLKHKATLR